MPAEVETPLPLPCQALTNQKTSKAAALTTQKGLPAKVWSQTQSKFLYKVHCKLNLTIPYQKKHKPKLSVWLEEQMSIILF